MLTQQTILEIEEVTLLLVYTLLKVVVEVVAMVQVQELVAVLVAEVHQEILKALGDVNLEKSIHRHG